MLVSYICIFSFHPNFLVIVFHCKCKRPAVISLKVENRKERTKDSVSKYCKVDRVQRHKIDSHKLQGTGEFLRLSLPGLLHRSGDKGCSASLSSARSANRRRSPVPWMFFLFEEKAATEESERCRQVAPPQPRACMLTGHAHITSCGLRGTAQSLKDTDLRRGLPVCGKGRGKWVDAGSIAPECASEMTLPPSSTHSMFSVHRVDSGAAAGPLHLLCLLFLQRGDRHLGSRRLPPPSTQHPQQQGEGAAGGSPLPAPPLQTRKKPKGCEL